MDLADWVMVQRLTNQHPRSPAASVHSHRSVDRWNKDGDGVYHFENPGYSIRSKKCDAGQFGRYQCVDAPLGKFVPSSGSMYATDASRDTSCHLLVSRVMQSWNYQASSGQTSCDAADAGYYVSGTAQTSQTACAANLQPEHRLIQFISLFRCRCWILRANLRSSQPDRLCCWNLSSKHRSILRVTMLMQDITLILWPIV